MDDIYIVMGINLIVWIGIFGYQFSLHKKINLLQSKIDKEDV
jgi:CcmD family protein